MVFSISNALAISWSSSWHVWTGMQILVRLKSLRVRFKASSCLAGLIFCRVFLNRQTAVAHQMVFTAIHEIVYQDTGKHLRWRHLHANSIEDFQGMILQWGADQHRGQAKGIAALFPCVTRLMYLARARTIFASIGSLHASAQRPT